MKKVIGVFITDTHLAENNIEIVKSIFRQTANKAKELGLTVIYHLGDIFHSRKGQTQEMLSVFDDILDELHNEDIKLILIPGNHDKQDYGSWKSFLKSYRHHPALDLIQEYGYYEYDGINIHMLPFFEDEIYIKKLEELKEKNGWNLANVLLTHIGFSGAIMNNGIPVESTVTLNHVSEFSLVLVGHYHDPQEIAGRVKYIGAALQHDFGENESKGLTILYDDLSTELIKLDFPKFRSFEIDVKALTTKDIADLKKEKEDSQDNIRIILKGDEKDIKAFNRQALIEVGVKVEMKEDKIDREELEHRVVPFDDKSLNEEFDVFCEKESLADIETGKKYLSKVLI
jgi:exonuclease SbcD